MRLPKHRCEARVMFPTVTGKRYDPKTKQCQLTGKPNGGVYLCGIHARMKSVELVKEGLEFVEPNIPKPPTTEMSMFNKNDDIDFVFIDDASVPFRVKDRESGTWLFSWNEGCRSWTTLRKVTFAEVIMMSTRMITPDRAKLYNIKH